MSWLLVCILLLPLVGALIGATLPQQAVRGWALLVSLATLVLVGFLVAEFNSANPAQARLDQLKQKNAAVDSAEARLRDDRSGDTTSAAGKARVDADELEVRKARFEAGDAQTLANGKPTSADLYRLTFGPVSGLNPLQKTSELQQPTSLLQIKPIGIGFRLGIDAIALALIVLTAGLAPLAIAASFKSIQTRQREYYAWMLALLAVMLGVFMARDLILFYVFFELTLVPMFFIIGIWGGPERRRAAVKFFLFTFAGSVFTLASVIYLGLHAGINGTISFDIADVIHYAQSASVTPHIRFWVFLGLLAGFAVKVPLFPVHTWLPLAHTEAPTAGSVILAGVLLKLGTYGLLRLAVPIGIVGADLHSIAFQGDLLPWFNFGHFTITLGGLVSFVGVLCVIGIIYGALVAWVQQDIKKLVAYSSVSHLGFCVLGLAALSTIGVQGSVLYMINHGISTGALFLVVGMIYDRYHTRDINELSGLARRMPVLAFFFILFALSSIGLPMLNGFVSEFLTILSAFISPHLGFGFGSFAALGVILGAVYMLHMAARVIWGPLKTPVLEGHGHGSDNGPVGAGHTGAGHGHQETGSGNKVIAHGQADHGQGASGGQEGHGGLPRDIGAREIAILIPLAVAVVWLGVMPTPLLDSIKDSSQQTIAVVDAPTPVADAQFRPPPPRSGFFRFFR